MFKTKSRVNFDGTERTRKIEEYLLQDLSLNIDPTYMGVLLVEFSKDALVRIASAAMLENKRQREREARYHQLMRG